MEYDSAGNLIRKYEYKQGIREGKSFEYYPSGQVLLEANYAKDKPSGEGFEYYQNGKLHKYYYYQEGELLYYKAYDQEGDLYDNKLPVNILQKEDSLIVSLSYSNLPHLRIGVIFGNLNAHKMLVDTLDVIAADGNTVRYNLANSNLKHYENLTGVLYEIAMPAQEITGNFPFDFKLNKNIDR